MDCVFWSCGEDSLSIGRIEESGMAYTEWGASFMFSWASGVDQVEIPNKETLWLLEVFHPSGQAPNTCVVLMLKKNVVVPLFGPAAEQSISRAAEESETISGQVASQFPVAIKRSSS